MSVFFKRRCSGRRGSIGSLLAVILFAVSCAPDTSFPERSDQPRILVPETVDTPARRSDSSGTGVVETAFEPRVAIDRKDSVIAVYHVNLDLEVNEEQVLLLKEIGNPRAPIRVAVIAYRGGGGDYAVTFESELAATNVRSTEALFVDLVGDHGIEIVCRGMDSENRQTLDVFRRTVSPSGLGPHFESIFTLSLAGTIEIVPLNRSEEYRSGSADGRSYPIKTLMTPPDATNLLDLVETRYDYRYADRRYVLVSQQRISGEVVAQSQLRTLYASGPTAFERWLDGVWYLETGENLTASYLYFEPVHRRFTHFTADIQEVYTWNDTYKILVNRVELTGVNELVPYIRKNLYVQVSGIDYFLVMGNDPWTGSYRRVPVEQIPISGAARVSSDIPELDGVYVSDYGHSLRFSGKHFVLDDSSEEGLFSVYGIGETAPILELKILDGSGVVRDSRRYRIAYAVETSDGKIYRTLVLTQGEVGIYGFVPSGDRASRYEQIEDVE